MKTAGIEIILITNTLYPYLRHNISVLSLPPGITYRFRYEKKYFAIDDIKELRGKLGLLVLRHFERGTFIPLRTFRFFRVELFGQFVFLELEFLNYVKYGQEQDVQEQEKEREKHNSTLSNAITAKNILNHPGAGMDKLVIPTSQAWVSNIGIDDRSNSENTLGYWNNIVTLLGGIDYYAKACFYLIASVKEIDSDREARLFEGKKRKGYKFYAKKAYLMQIFQLMASRKAPPPPGFNIEFQCISQHVLPMRNSEIVDGPYDRLEFYFYVLPQEIRRVNSFIIVENKQQLFNPKQEKESVTIPASFLQTNVKWTKWEFMRKRIFPIPIVALGSLIYYFSNEIGPWLNQLGLQVKPELLKPQLIQLLGLILIALGAGSWASFAGAFKAQAGPKS